MNPPNMAYIVCEYLLDAKTFQETVAKRVPTINTVVNVIQGIFFDVGMTVPKFPIDFMHGIKWRWVEDQKELWFDADARDVPAQFEDTIEDVFMFKRGTIYSVATATVMNETKDERENRVAYVFSNENERPTIPLATTP